MTFIIKIDIFLFYCHQGHQGFLRHLFDNYIVLNLKHHILITGKCDHLPTAKELEHIKHFADADDDKAGVATTTFLYLYLSIGNSSKYAQVKF